MSLDDGTRELKRALTDPDGGGGVFKAAITDDEGILAEILARLPVKSVMRFRCVCKPWRALIAAPYFRNKHFDYAERGIGHNTSRLLFSMEPPRSLDLEALKNMDLEEEDCFDAISELDYPVTVSDYVDWKTFILGSCNGLVCLYVYLKGILIWNPSTRETSDVLPIPPGGYFASRECNYGFGYDSTTEDYKLVISQTRKTHIFAPKTGLWRTLRHPDNHHIFLNYGSFFNGALHWFVPAKILQRAKVVSFNLEEEGFQEMAPLPYIKGLLLCGELLVLGNCLCVVQLFHLSDRSSVCVVTEYGVVTKSWTQVMKFSIGPLESSFRSLRQYLPLCTLKHGMVLVTKSVNDDMTGMCTTSMLLVNQTTSEIIFEAEGRRMLRSAIYRESLVSPVTLAGSFGGLNNINRKRKKLRNQR